MKRFLISSLFFCILIVIWQLVAQANFFSNILLPSPLEIARYFVASIKDGSLMEGCYVTLRRLAQGYIASVCIGIPIGLLNAKFEILEDTLGVVALGLQALPSVCWAPLAILWFGQTETAMFFIVVMGSVGSIILTTYAGVTHVPPIYVRAAHTMGSTGMHTWVKVIIPAALPFIVTGMKQGWAFSWRSLMAAEIYVTILTGFGLGHLLHYARELHAMDAVMGIMLLIIVLGLLIDKIFFGPLERFMHERWGTKHIKIEPPIY